MMCLCGLGGREQDLEVFLLFLEQAGIFHAIILFKYPDFFPFDLVGVVMLVMDFFNGFWGY